MQDSSRYITKTGLLVVENFENINLLGSVKNEPKADGFFKYSIRPSKNVSGGNRIGKQCL
ncbi:MAG: hypothetical protein IPL08_17205 [Saprospiraceae bacterium]|nr:hypothetical protein [Saprospiraceae bacterium]